MNLYSYDRRRIARITFLGLPGVGVQKVHSVHDQEELIQEVEKALPHYIRQYSLLATMFEKLGHGLESDPILKQGRDIQDFLKGIQHLPSKLETLVHPLKQLEAAVIHLVQTDSNAGAREAFNLSEYKKYVELAKSVITLIPKGEAPSSYMEDYFGEDCDINEKFQDAEPEVNPFDEELVPDAIYGYLYHISDTDNLVKIRAAHPHH